MERRAVRYLLDSVIVIDHLNGVAAATDFLIDHGPECAISVITRAELLTGCDLRTGLIVREFLDAFHVLSIDAPVADLAASLRRKEHWKLPDALQAALAMTHGLTLVTRNTRDFKSGKTLKVVVPYRG